MENWWDILTRGDQVAAAVPGEVVLLTILLAFAVGHVIGWVYMWTHTGLSYSQAFVASLAVLPALVALTMVVLTGDLAIALGLLAIFAIVRFRNVLKDTRDTTFVLWAILQGMALGTMRFSLAAMICGCLALFFIYLRMTQFGSRQRYDVILSLQAAGANLTSLPLILRRHSLHVTLASQRDGAAEQVDLSYRLLLRDPKRGSDLVQELREMPGVANVSLFERREETEV